MRLFTALSLDNQQKRAIYEWKESYLPDLYQSIPADNYHLSLAFYGEVQASQLEPLIERLSSSLHKQNMPPLQLKLQDLNYWPSKGMLWICPKIWPPALNQLADRHAQVGAQFGAKKAKHTYLPHITLARNLEAAPAHMPPVDISLSLRKLTLFESMRGNGRMHYHSLMDWTL